MRKFNILYLTVFVFIVFLFYTIIKFIQIKPFMDGLFENADNLTHNQKLIDSFIVLYDEYDNRIEILLKDSLCFNFFSFNQIGINYNFNESCFNVGTSLNYDLLDFKKRNNISGKVFKCDTSKLPLKHKKINLPYRLKVYNYNVVESIIQN